MSEYQYYEFQALDQPLTAEARAEMKRLSSRVHLTATSASFEYSYGDFRGDPFAVLTKYFDAMLYISNWGTRQVMFRLPEALVPASVRQQYQYDDHLEWSSKGEQIILNISLIDENGDQDWIEGAGLLAQIAPIRAELLHGDYRALYLGWLMTAQSEFEVLEEDEDLTEPPVPPDLQTLTPALHSMVDYFGLDPDLVTAAAQASPKANSVANDLIPLINQLSETEQRDFLTRLLRGERHLDVVLAQRLRTIAGAPTNETAPAERRTIRTLVAAAEQIRQQRLAVECEARKAARLKQLEKVGQRASALWTEIPQLIDQRRGDAYDEAVRILKDLHDLAVHQQRMDDFQTRLTAIRGQFPTLRGFHARLKEAGL